VSRGDRAGRRTPGGAEGARARAAADRARSQLRRGSERAGRAGARISRGLGEPALFAIMLSSVVSGLFMVLGVVAGDALGLTPAAFLASGLFFVFAIATYVEGSSLHPERGGASTFARYAFDELWSFIAGWAILLDYLIVMAIGAVAISDYLAVFWTDLDEGVVEVVIAGLALVYVAAQNVRGLGADRLGMVLRLALLGILLLLTVSAIALAQNWDPGSITDTVDLGASPEWDQLLFATVVAGVALVGVEAASGLAGEVRVGRRGLRRVVGLTAVTALVLFVCVSTAALMTLPVVNGETPLGGRYSEAPVLGVVSQFHPDWLNDAARAAVGALGAALLLVAMNSQMLGIARLSYSLATNRQIPSAAGRLHDRRGTPYIAITIAALIAFALAIPHDLDFLAGIFAFGAMITISIAHVSVIVLRYRESGRPTAFRVPVSLKIGRGAIPVPTVLGAVFSILAWVSVVVLHEGARVVGGAWMAIGIAMYAIYRRAQGKPLTKRFTIPPEALQEAAPVEYGSILVPVFGEALDDDIIGTAGRLASEHPDEAEGGAVVEALYVFEIPMSLPIDARVPDERVKKAKQVLARAKEVGEEYEGVEVATAMVRGRTIGQAIVAEARRRGVEAIVLAAEQPTRVRSGPILGGRGRTRDRFVGETTRYVIEKAPCRVILTAPPAGEEGTREGVLP
jgi:basic amino acid/polyamine antiporter, APA family